MSNGWTPERRAKAAEQIRAREPWKRSTGPRTDEGKAIASRNAFKGGWRAQLRVLRKDVNTLLRELRELVGSG